MIIVFERREDALDTRNAHLGKVGNTDQPASKIAEIALEALKGAESAPTALDVFWSSTPRSGGTLEQLKVSFEKFDDENEAILYGHTSGGQTVIFFLSNPGQPATVLFVEDQSPDEAA
jgi:hypothetical protein